MKADTDIEPALRARFIDAAGPVPTHLPRIESALRLRATRRRTRRRSMIAVLALSAAVPVAVAVQRSSRPSDNVVMTAAGGAPSSGSDGIFRPLLNIDGCVTPQASERALLGAGEPMNAAASTQVIHQPDLPPPSGPLVIIFRSKATAATADPVRSGTIAVDPVARGRQGGATWSLTDGSEATAYARNITTEELTALLKSLQPKPAAAEGFLLQPSPGSPASYVSNQVSSTSPSATVATSRCEVAGDASHILTVTAVTGPQPGAFAALLETSASAATTQRGDTMLFVDGTRHAEAETALTQIRDATRTNGPDTTAAPRRALNPAPPQRPGDPTQGNRTGAWMAAPSGLIAGAADRGRSCALSSPIS